MIRPRRDEVNEWITKWITFLISVSTLQSQIISQTYLLNPFLLYPLRCRDCFFILIILETVGLLGRVISSSQGLHLNTGQYKYRINTCTYQTSMPFVRFEPTISASERAETVHELDRSATLTGSSDKRLLIYFRKHMLKSDSIWKYYYNMTRGLEAAVSESEPGVHCHPTVRWTYSQALQE
jgi:hypothetical protein